MGFFLDFKYSIGAVARVQLRRAKSHHTFRITPSNISGFCEGYKLDRDKILRKSGGNSKQFEKQKGKLELALSRAHENEDHKTQAVIKYIRR